MTCRLKAVDIGCSDIADVGLMTDMRAMDPYLRDESRLEGSAERVWAPRDEREVVAVIRHESSIGGRITISGNRTGLVGGAVPSSGSVMTLGSMGGLRAVGRDEGGPFVRVGPALSLEELASRLLSKDLDDVIDLDGSLAELLRSDVVYGYPVDPTETAGSICGNVATNASGARTFRYGATRGWVRRLRVVLPWGEVLDITRGEHTIDDGLVIEGKGEHRIPMPQYESPIEGAVKNATGLFHREGMDPIDLFIGSEGILGVIVEADVWLTEMRPGLACLMFLPGTDEAMGMVDGLRSMPELEMDFIEFIDEGGIDLIRDHQSKHPGVFDLPPLPERRCAAVFFDMPLASAAECSRLIEGVAREHGGGLGSSWCAHEPREIARLKALRHAVPGTVFERISELKREHPGIHKLGTDMSVPDEASLEMMTFYRSRLEEESLEYVMFGHIGNNHPHIEILMRDETEFERGIELYDEFAMRAIALGGSPSAEHGVGRIKREYVRMMFGDEAVDQMLGLKDAFDPDGLLNRDVMVMR